MKKVNLNEYGINPPIRGSIDDEVYTQGICSGINPPIRGSIVEVECKGNELVKRYQSPYKGFNRYAVFSCVTNGSLYQSPYKGFNRVKKGWILDSLRINPPIRGSIDGTPSVSCI